MKFRIVSNLVLAGLLTLSVAASAADPTMLPAAESQRLVAVMVNSGFPQVSNGDEFGIYLQDVTCWKTHHVDLGYDVILGIPGYSCEVAGKPAAGAMAFAEELFKQGAAAGVECGKNACVVELRRVECSVSNVYGDLRADNASCSYER